MSPNLPLFHMEVGLRPTNLAWDQVSVENTDSGSLGGLHTWHSEAPHLRTSKK